MPAPIIGGLTRNRRTPPEARVGLVWREQRHERSHRRVALALRIHRGSHLKLGIRYMGQPVLMIGLVLDTGQADLVQVRQAGRLGSPASGSRQGRKQHAGQNCDDRDHHEQFDQREATAFHPGPIANNPACRIKPYPARRRLRLEGDPATKSRSADRNRLP